MAKSKSRRPQKHVKLRKIHDSMYLIEFPTQYQLAATFLRFQEFYESSRFHGKVFSMEEYMDWYAEKFGNFTYYDDWAGFNIPSRVLQPFREGRFDPLLDKEKKLLELLANIAEEFYVIGVVGNDDGIDPATLVHELAHALFSTDDEYRRGVRKRLKEYDTSNVRRVLEDQGYCKQVLPDEVHAYLLSNDSTLPASLRRSLRPLSRELRRLYRTHASGFRIT